MKKKTPAQKKLTTYLKKQYPDLKEKNIPEVLSGIKRFVNVVRKIYTEPQAQISIKELKINGVKQKKRIITTAIKEVVKVIDKTENKHDLKETLDKFHKKVIKK